MNKKIKKVKKLYQATIDGGDSIFFHKKFDNIQNTLILIKSEEQRRFGGFTPIPWKSEEEEKQVKDPEMKTFVFSLDNKKIYYLVNSNVNAIYHHKKSGPCFGGGEILVQMEIRLKKILFILKLAETIIIKRILFLYLKMLEEIREKFWNMKYFRLFSIKLKYNI